MTVVIGVGGLGHLGMQILKAMPATRAVASTQSQTLSPSRSKREEVS